MTVARLAGRYAAASPDTISTPAKPSEFRASLETIPTRTASIRRPSAKHQGQSAAPSFTAVSGAAESARSGDLGYSYGTVVIPPAAAK